MADGGSLPANTAAYEAIEAAVMETARGRWFLAEYARRNRTADTTLLLDAIGRLEQAVAGERRADSLNRRAGLAEMAEAIGRAKGEVASFRPAGSASGPRDASPETLDGIAPALERATAEILDAAERVQEAAWTLRESGASGPLCDILDRRAAAIYSACSLQELATRRAATVVATLRDLESRIDAVLKLGGEAASAESPAPRPVGEPAAVAPGRQAVRDAGATVEVGPAPVAAAAAPANPVAASLGAGGKPPVRERAPAEPPRPAPASGAPPEAPEPPRVSTRPLAALDALPTREKLRRFT